jgi:hypothetical protein
VPSALPEALRPAEAPHRTEAPHLAEAPHRAEAPQPAEAPALLDIRSLLHPTEHSRLIIALSSSTIVLGVAATAVYFRGGWQMLAGLAGALAVLGTVIWLLRQVARSRLLGRAVRVSEMTLPELQSVLDEVRTRLDYHKHVDVYVTDQVDGGSAMTSYLGTRLIQIEGGLVAELLADGRRAELTYLIARHIGQLKARHQRMPLIVLAISMADSLKFLQLFLAPYFRATAKSGDQIAAAACCGDIQATAAMMNRLLVGRELGPRLAVMGVLDQAATVRRRWLPRLAQLFMSAPHATNRYLNLLTFSAALGASANRRPPRRRPHPVSVLLATVVTVGVLAACGWLTLASSGRTNPASLVDHGSTPGPRPSQAPAITGTPAATASTGPTGTGPTGTGTTGTGITGTGITGTTAASPSHQLLARMPPGFAQTCQAVPLSGADAAQGADAEVTCQPAALGSDGYVTYVHYQTVGAMESVYADLARGVPSGDCTSGDGQGSYQQGSSAPAGGYACYVSTTGHREVAWTDNRLSILSVATSRNMTLAGLYHWWLGDTGPEQTPS